jgi:cell division protein ZapA (FtsZ GTPase activity inhibitor)
VSTKTNKLQQLVERFEALPRQKENVQAKIQLATIADRVDQHAQGVKQSLGQVDVLREVLSQPELLDDEIAKLRKSVRSSAQTLEQQVRAEGQTQRITVALETLTKSTRAMTEAVTQAWAASDNDVRNTTEALISLTGTYDPVTQRELQKALDRFKRAQGPSGHEGVAAYREARGALLQMRLELNIPGSVGHFLSDALRGAGSVKMLADPEVKAFLDKHPILWTKLSVRLT